MGRWHRDAPVPCSTPVLQGRYAFGTIPVGQVQFWRSRGRVPLRPPLRPNAPGRRPYSPHLAASIVFAGQRESVGGSMAMNARGRRTSTILGSVVLFLVLLPFMLLLVFCTGWLFDFVQSSQPTEERTSDPLLIILYGTYGSIVFALAMSYLYWSRRRAHCSHAAVLRCKYCNYELTGNVSGYCPECGLRR